MTTFSVTPTRDKAPYKTGSRSMPHRSSDLNPSTEKLVLLAHGWSPMLTTLPQTLRKTPLPTSVETELSPQQLRPSVMPRKLQRELKSQTQSLMLKLNGSMMVETLQELKITSTKQRTPLNQDAITLCQPTGPISSPHIKMTPIRNYGIPLLPPLLRHKRV